MKISKIAGIFAVVAFALTAVSANAAFTRSLTLGSTGADVIELQTLLESKGFLTIPAGTSKGYFGAMTQSALAKFQAANGIAPATGYFGPITMAKVAAMGTTTPGSTSTGDLSGGEASLESFDLSSGDDSEVEEGASADIAEIEFDVEDADVVINRIDLALVASVSTPDNEEKDPWDTFDSITLSVDGDEIAEMDLDDEDMYLDEDAGTIRLSNIDFKVEEGETATIVVALTAQNSVDGADADAAEWTINVLENGVRATDAEGLTQEIGDETDTVTFDIVVEGDGEALNVSTSKEDPEATTLKVEDNAKSDTHSIFAFDLEAEESDIELDSVEIIVETGTAAVIDVVSEFVLEIDGEEFDDWTASSTGATSSVITFDIDGDFTVDADSEVLVVLMAELKAANGTNYATSGETISANIADLAINGEGADDVDSDGVAAGEEHALEIAGIIVDESGFADKGSDDNNDANTSRDYTFTFEVEAFEEDFYIATSSITVFVEGAGTTTDSFTVDSTGDEDTDGVFTVSEGTTETFTVVVTISDVSTAGQYRVGLDSVNYTENSNGTSGLAGPKDVLNSDFRTAYATVN